MTTCMRDHHCTVKCATVSLHLLKVFIKIFLYDREVGASYFDFIPSDDGASRFPRSYEPVLG